MAASMRAPLTLCADCWPFLLSSPSTERRKNSTRWWFGSSSRVLDLFLTRHFRFNKRDIISRKQCRTTCGTWCGQWLAFARTNLASHRDSDRNIWRSASWNLSEMFLKTPSTKAVLSLSSFVNCVKKIPGDVIHADCSKFATVKLATTRRVSQSGSPLPLHVRSANPLWREKNEMLWKTNLNEFRLGVPLAAKDQALLKK